VRAETLEERVQSLESQLKLLKLHGEEARAIEIMKKFAKKYGLDISGGTVRRTSSRFCLGVEHGDYNGTQLFGVGTDRFIWVGYKPNKLGKVRLFSYNFAEEGVVEYVPGKVPAAQSPEISDTWARFPYGVDHVLRSHGLDSKVGFDAVVVGNIPGGGMSRSASLIINLLLTAMDVNKHELPEGDFKVVTWSHEVETKYVGTPCGMLDQIMIYYAKEGMGTRYDPKTQKITHVPLGLDADEFRIAALDTGTVRHGLEKSTYAIRVKECQALVKAMQAKGSK
jgi:galactokinase